MPYAYSETDPYGGQRRAFYGAIIVGALLAIIAAIVIGGWQLGWWASNSATNHRAHIYEHSYGTQSAYVEQDRNLISQVTTIDVQLNDPATPASEHPSLTAQKSAIVTQACNMAHSITEPPSDIAQFMSAHCP